MLRYLAEDQTTSAVTFILCKETVIYTQTNIDAFASRSSCAHRGS